MTRPVLPKWLRAHCPHVWQHIGNKPIYDAFAPGDQIGSRKVENCGLCGTTRIHRMR